MVKEIRVGLIGYGFIGKVHTIAYRDIPLCLEQPQVSVRLTALLRSRPGSEGEAAGAGFDRVTTDPDEFYAQPLDIVDICTPNHLHLGAAERALRTGAAVYCEKPLAEDLAAAVKMVNLAQEYQALTQTAFVYRFVPAVRQLKTVIESGEIGEVLNFRAKMFHGSYVDPERTMSWRLRKAEAGGGAFMDMGVHLTDLARYLLGEVSTVRALSRTFIQERRTERGSAAKQRVDVDDWMLCTLEMTRGAVGVIEVTRQAAGAGEATSFEVFGSKGSAEFRVDQPDFARMYSLRLGKWFHGPFDASPQPGERPVQQIWPGSKFSQGFMTNVHLAAAYSFALDTAEKQPSAADFSAGAAAQEVVEAAYRSADRDGEKVALPLSL